MRPGELPLYVVGNPTQLAGTTKTLSRSGGVLRRSFPCCLLRHLKEDAHPLHQPTRAVELMVTRSRAFYHIICGVFVLAGCVSVDRDPSSSNSSSSNSSSSVLILRRVVDGDTVVLQRHGAPDETVRLLGIDTPETKRPNTPIQCFGPEASTFTKRLLPAGTRVRIVRDVEARDRYGRLLAYVYRADDGVFVNLELARQGFAVPYTYPPNIAHADLLVAAAAEARDAGRGLWGTCPARAAR